MTLDEHPFPEHVRAEIAAGRLWRAKEILAGRASTMPFDADRFEQYGIILIATHDVIEAGRYLFVSGRRAPQYEEAIAAFLSRHEGKSGNALLRVLPARVHGLPLTQLPLNVQDELRARGWRDGRPLQARSSSQPRLQDYAVFVGCGAALLFIIASIIAGAPVVSRLIESLFR